MYNYPNGYVLKNLCFQPSSKKPSNFIFVRSNPQKFSLFTKYTFISLSLKNASIFHVIYLWKKYHYLNNPILR